jgi:3-hydroxy-9,10-secoandrosta-1,3,5(10)-triene-9,17-dione monooxygenase
MVTAERSAMPEANRRPQAPPRFDELMARAEALVPQLRERAARAEELRQMPDETIADLHSAGLFRMLQPARVGGSELPFRALFELTAVIGQGCGSTSWVLANLAAHHWLLGMWHPEAQEEIWSESADSLISSALIFPRGRASRVPGGYRLSGRWSFSSGIDASSWNMVGAIVSDEETGQSEARMFLLPKSDYTIIDTWQVIGLGATGSKDVEVADVFVPAYRTLSTERIRGGPNRGSELNPGSLYRLPAVSLFGFAIAGVSLGIARGAIWHFAETTRNRLSAYTGRNIADLNNIQIHLAEAAALADAAEALALRDCDEATHITDAGIVPSIEQRGRYKRDGAFAATLCTRAVDVLFSATGGGAIYARNPIQRAFRDVHAANAHYNLNWDVNGAIYGRVALGRPPDAPL